MSQMEPFDHYVPWNDPGVPSAPQQLNFFPPLEEPEYEPEATIQDRFAAFHAANPQVFIALRDLALDLVRRGRTRIGIGMLTEVLRWSSLRTDGDPWKINNSYRSRYARLLADTFPELASAFEMRELKSE